MLLKNVLILCYDYPPLVSIGANRPAAFFRHLHKYGFRTTVVTRKWGEGIQNTGDFVLPDKPGATNEESVEGTLIKIPRTPNLRDGLQLRFGANRFVPVRKGLTFLEATLGWFLPFLDTKHYLYKAAEEYMKKNSVDVIIASGEPFCTFNYARKLSNKFNVPYVLDYRDGWTENYLNSPQMPFLKRVMVSIQGVIEKQCITKAAFFISVSEPLVARISESFGGKEGTVIANGVELDDVITEKEPANTNVFNILYTGTLYDVQLVNVFLDGFLLFYERAKQPSDVHLEWIGISLRFSNHIASIQAFAKKIPNVVTITPPLKRVAIVEKQQDAHVLVSFIATSQKTGWMGGKTYEYAATKKPIIIIPTEPERETTFFPGRDIQHFCLTPEEVAERLGFFYEAFKSGKPFQTSITDDEIFSISREAEVKKLALKIHEIRRT